MDDPSPEQVNHRPTGLTWLFGLSILAAAGVAAWLLAAHASWPMAAALVMIVAIGGVLYRVVRVNAVGIALWCLAVLLISVQQWTPISEHVQGFKDVHGIFASLFLMTGSIVFLVSAARQRHRRAGNCAGCILAFFTLIICATVANDVHNRRRQIDDVERTTHTLITLHKLANDIESIRTRIGRLPTDEQELVRLRGKPMPTYRGEYRISYIRHDPDGYALSCCQSDFWGSHWDIFGWIFHYYGPRSTQRLHVELF